MSFGSSHEIKERVREATDLVDVISRSIRLRRQGRGYVGLCPWHDDSRPSLQVNPERQSWKCWVCDEGGDVFSFVMKREGVDFREALRMLADRAGIQLAGASSSVPAGSAEDKQMLYRAVAWAEQQFHQCLLESPGAQAARDYLNQRGILDESVRKFHLGYSPDEWQWLLSRAESTPFSPAILESAGLVGRHEASGRVYDRFRGRLMFSIRDTEHRPIAFGGRILPQAAATSGPPTSGASTRAGETKASSAPKYINSPETRLFTKSNHLYALDIVREQAIRKGQIIVVEGYTDVIMAHQHGLPNVVAALGTALGQRHVRLLQRFADTITLVLDGDDAGQRRTNEVLELFIAAQVDLRVLTLPSGLDPCDFLRQRDADAFRTLLASAVDALEHKVHSASGQIDVVSQPDAAHRALEEILKTMAGAPKADAAAGSLLLREQTMLARLARRFHVDEATLRQRLSELRSRSRKPTNPAGGPRDEGDALTPYERELFEILVVHPSLVTVALEQVNIEHLRSSMARELWQLFVEADVREVGFEFATILTIADRPALKSRLVAIDEQARGKDERAAESAQQRLLGLVRRFDLDRQRADHRRELAELEDHQYDEKEEISVLEKMIQQERHRHGISAPTDG